MLKTNLITLAGTYRFVPQNWIHPIAKLRTRIIEHKKLRLMIKIQELVLNWQRVLRRILNIYRLEHWQI
jgi:hypothetical protein